MAISGAALDPFNASGIVGAGLVVAAYFANQQGWLKSDSWPFPAANLAGSLLILISLLFEWNLPSVIIEVFWAMISLYGLVRCYARGRPG